ncbi:MAG: twin-arginine translocase TatA/TatE family subunit [Pseudomonadota bacterium]
MSIGPWQIILVVVLIVLLFGRGKISELMGDVAKGIKSFKAGIKDDEQSQTAETRALDHETTTTTTASTQSEKTSASS